MNHNQLQSKCFLHMWNEYPDLRYLCFSVTNNLTTETIDARRQMAIQKSLGVVKGVLDLIFFYGGRMYGLDAKVGSDRLHKEQVEFIDAIRRQGGDGCEFRTFEEFKAIIGSIVQDGKLPDWVVRGVVDRKEK